MVVTALAAGAEHPEVSVSVSGRVSGRKQAPGSRLITTTLQKYNIIFITKL